MDIPVADLKKKRDSLMSSYRTYKKKVRDSINSGSGSDEIYKPIWFAYELMDSFLGEGVQNKETINTEEASINHPNEEEEQASNLSENMTVSQTIRRRKNPTELSAAGDVVKDALSTLKTTFNARYIQEEDECDLHGKIIAKKLRRLPEYERATFICEIYKMFQRCDQLNRQQLQANESTISISSPSPSPQPQPQNSKLCCESFTSDRRLPSSQSAYSESRPHSSRSFYSEPPIHYAKTTHIPKETTTTGLNVSLISNELNSSDIEDTSTPKTRIIITSNQVLQPEADFSFEDPAVNEEFHYD